MVTGTILEVEDFPEAKRSAYKLTIDLGKLGIKIECTDNKIVQKRRTLGKTSFMCC